MICRIALTTVLGLSLAVPAAAVDPYATEVELSNGKAGAPTTLSFSFRASGSALEKLGEMDLRLAEGSRVNPDAFGKKCALTEQGPKAGGVCAEKFEDARVGKGQMTVEMLGMHTVKADAYLVEGGPDGANLLFFFAAGQVFGVGAQSVFGRISLDPGGPATIEIHDIQKQLDLPFGASAELEEGRFTFSGESGKPAFTNPAAGALADWTYTTTLSWSGGTQTQRVRATAGKK